MAGRKEGSNGGSRVVNIGEAEGSPVEKLYHQKKHRLCFHLLIVMCITLVFCYTMSSNSLQWWETSQIQTDFQWLVNQTDEKYTPSPFRIHSEHKAGASIVQTTTVQTTTTKAPTEPPSTTQYNPSNAHNYQFLIDNRDTCKNHSPFLVLMVPVLPQDVLARKAIRQTWAKERLVQGKVVVTMFLLGLSNRADTKTLMEENQQYHDLIQSNFMDTYKNLTVKTMVIMDWLAKRCPTAQYAMKIDSDMFLNVDNLVTMLQKPGVPKENYLTGWLMFNRDVVRTKSSKWYVPEEMLPDPVYPTYVLGMGYVFSNDLPAKMVEVAKSIKYFNNEDAYVGMCMKVLGLKPVQPPKGSSFGIYAGGFDRCRFLRTITYILNSPQQLMKYWKNMKKPGRPC